MADPIQISLACARRSIQALDVDIEQSIPWQSVWAALRLALQNNTKKREGHTFGCIWNVRHRPAFSFAPSKQREFVAGSSQFRPQNRLGFVAGLRRIANALKRAALCVATSVAASDPPREAETARCAP